MIAFLYLSVGPVARYQIRVYALAADMGTYFGKDAIGTDVGAVEQGLFHGFHSQLTHINRNALCFLLWRRAGAWRAQLEAA